MQKHIIQVERNKSITGSIASFWLKPVSSFLILVMFAELIMPLRSMGSVRERFEYRTNSQGYVITDLDRNERFIKPAEKAMPAIPSEISKTFKPAIGGPGQPEMSSFQSVNNSNMVDLFTGDFSYNIPLMDVGGYPLNIHYTGGITMDQEASWVGLGWNLNPGAISRSMRGVPDDFNGADSITKSQSMKANTTYGVTLFGDKELLGKRLPFRGSIGIFKNTYNGWGVSYSMNPTLNLSLSNRTTLNPGFTLSANSQSGFTVSPSIYLRMLNSKTENEGFTSMGLSTGFSSRAGLQSLSFSATGSIDKNKYPYDKSSPGSVTVSGALTFATPAMTPSIQMPITSEGYNINATLGLAIFGLHPNVRMEGYVNRQMIRETDQVQKLPAYGYIFYEASSMNPSALMDLNREKDGQFSYGATPAIALPQFTYDVYTISGEGSGGAIRPYRGDMGYAKDPSMRTTNQNTNLGVEFGVVPSFHGGGSIDRMEASTRVGAWTGDNDLASRLQFRSADSNYQHVYFRNPGERTSNTKAYYDQIGWDSLMRVKLLQVGTDRVRAANALIKYDGLNPVSASIVQTAPIKKERDKRTQVVSWLNADEASLFGLDKQILSYPENLVQDPACMSKQIIARVDGQIRKGHHLSQATVLNADGKRYIYGLPAYNVEQYDVSFAVDRVSSSLDLDKGFAPVERGVDDSLGQNTKGKDNYFSSEKIPAYAHSFLLTAILSPDYVDVTGNGITEDDLGDAVKFNYSRVFGPNNGYYAWRTPGARNKASYNEGLKTYSRDDKASYFYGRKEVWYTHSVESKTMVAFFHTSPNRPDAWSAIDIAGGYDTNRQLRRLDSISLYAKSDLIRNGTNARPIKTVHFEYSFDLCKGVDTDRPNQGKLSLRKVWFSYFNNKKEINNGYVFSYSSVNPNYHPRNSDRWGNFKTQSGNPGGLSNADYPYAIQDSTTAALNASAWQLSEIRLPSHGRIKVTYESDDYAFVQNKKAMAMVSVAGFAARDTLTPTANLYDSHQGFDYIFFNTPVPIANSKDLYHKYLEGNEYLYMKLAVKVPTDIWGSGSEIIPIYGKIVKYGIVNSNQFWVQLEKVGRNSAITRSVFQFLRSNLPSKAFPGSENDDDLRFLEVVRMLSSSLGEIANSVNGFTEQGMKRGWCRQVDLSKSFARLNVPTGIKYGGGYRVKKVEIFDNWNVMSGGKQESVYGQVYQYKTSIVENNKVKIVSSGVAAYEPMIGNEENPFRQPVTYQEKVAPMAPVNNLYIEMPVGESYYPAATIGYSKVRVRTIHTKAKSVNGWQESEFFTTRDFPTRVIHTPLDNDAQKRYKTNFTNFLKVNAIDRVTVSQGFLIELNDMNGKLKGNAVYSESDSIHPVSYTRNFFREKWENGVRKLSNNVWVIDSANGRIDSAGVVGLDIEVMADFRQVISTSTTVGINGNTEGIFIPFLGVVPIPFMWKLPNSDEALFRSAALVKVVQRYGIVDSIEVMDKGSIVSTRNLVFDGVSGEPILTRTKNNFNDPIYSFNYPAHWAYSGMGAAYKNIDLVLSGVKFMEGKLYYKDSKEFPVSRFFESGDELMVTAVEDVTKISSSNSCPEYVVQLANPAIPSILSKPKVRKIWAIDLAKTGTGIGIYFIDESGRGYTGLNAELRILRSGKRNLLSASVGSVAMRNNPVVKVNGQYVIQISNSLKVLQASANSFSDAWKVENSLYQIDSCYQKLDTVPPLILKPTTSMLMRQYLKRRLPFGGLREMTLAPTKNYLDSAYLSASMQGFQTRTYKTKTVIKFNLDAIPVNATVISANLALDSYKASGIWQNNDIDNLSWQSFVKSHYISGTDLNGRTNAAVLKNVSTRWSISTPFDELYTGSATVNVSATSNLSCDNRAVNVLSLIQEAKANPTLNQGFVFQLSNYVYSRNADELRAMTFNSGWGRITEDADPPNPCFYGAPPLLTVVYSVMKDTCVKLCRYNINDTMTNPYRWGILGNWRADRAYTYFSARESLTFESGGTDIRKQGAILDFSPYWTFNSTKLNSASDTSRWVWNAAQSKFNTRGLETENYDALGRYNAGLYGYKQSMPVAVAQNARSREIWSDGFEDYNYTNAACINCPKTRDQDFVTGKFGVGLDSLETHSGRYSLRVNAGASSQITIPVAPIGLDSLSPFIIANVDSTPIYGGGFDVVGLGNGLQGTFSGRYMVADREIAWDGSGINPNIELTGANFSEWMLPYSSGAPVLPSQPRKLTILPSDERFINNVRGWAHTTDEIYGSPRTILGTTEQDLYNAERFGVFDYTIPIANGDYTVVFKFCELYHNLVGKRVFNVDLNHNRVLSNFDILANVAKFTAHTRSFNVTVTNGQLKIDFSAVVDNASITAIDIISRNGGEQNNTPATGYSFKNLDAEWVGYIQPAYTDDYTFYLKGSGTGSVFIGENEMVNTVLESNDQGNKTISLQAGQLYPIKVSYSSGGDNTGSLIMSWSGANLQTYEVVPQKVLYTTQGLASGSLIPKVAGYCKSLRGVRASNMLVPKLSPLPDKEYIVTLWVKTDGVDGVVANTANDAVTFKFNNESVAHQFTRTGVKIEGWQRLEALVKAPAGASTLMLAFNAPGSSKLYFDDLRIQPYNSGLKSFVYDHISLKLMAELDENNYTTFYEYDDDGTLIRVKKETERGVQTIKETRSALIKN